MIGNGILKRYTKVNDFNEMLNGNCHKCNCYHIVKQIVGMPILLGWLSRFIGNCRLLEMIYFILYVLFKSNNATATYTVSYTQTQLKNL